MPGMFPEAGSLCIKHLGDHLFNRPLGLFRLGFSACGSVADQGGLRRRDDALADDWNGMMQ